MADGKTIFEKIAAREIPAEIVYEDEWCLCFRDIEPEAPVHLLLVPKKAVPRLAAAGDEAELLGHLFSRVPLIAEAEGFLETGFRVVVNSGRDGGESVPHLHLHILAGRRMKWPPG